MHHHSGLTDSDESDVDQPLMRTSSSTIGTDSKDKQTIERRTKASSGNAPSATSIAISQSVPYTPSMSAFSPPSSPSASPGSPSPPVNLADEIACWRLRVSFFNVLCVSIAFCLLFSAFNTIQSYVTSLLPDGLGNISLTVCYLSVVLTVVFAPATVQELGEPLSMTLGACCYCLYMASLISLQPTLLIFCSIIVGFGGSILWVASGSFLNRCSEEHERGRNTGLFWAIFQSSAIIGNLSAYFIFTHVTSTQLFIIFCVIGCAGASVLLCLRPLPDRYYVNEPFSKRGRVAVANAAAALAAASSSTPTAINGETTNVDVLETDSDASDGEDDEEAQAVGGVDKTKKKQKKSAAAMPVLPVLSSTLPVVPLAVATSPTFYTLIKQVFALLQETPILWLSCMFFFNGMEYSFWNGEFPQILPKDSIGLILCCAGVMEVIGGSVLGTVSDRIGKPMTLVFGSVVYAIGLLVAAHKLMFQAEGIKPQWESIRLYAYFCAGCFGLADSAFNTQVFALLGAQYPTSGTIAFTAYNFIQSIGMTVGFGYQLYFPMHGSHGTLAQIYVQMGLLITGTIGFLMCEKHFAKTRLNNSKFQSTSIQ